MARRFTGLLVVSMSSSALLLAIGCTSTGGRSNSTSEPSGTSSLGASRSAQQVMPLFLQCLATLNVTIWDKAQGDTSVVSLGRQGGWYISGRVVADNSLYSNADAIEGFYPISSDFKPEQTIAAWVDDAVSNGTWPKACGPLP